MERSQPQGEAPGAGAGVRAGSGDLRSPTGPVWLDGELVSPERATIPLTDPAVQSGLGVFETLAVKAGRPLDWDDHLSRLKSAASKLAVPLPEDETLAGGAASVARCAVGEFGWLKIMAERTGSCAIFGGPVDPSEEGRPVSAILLPWRRHRRDPLAGLKTINYAAFALGLEQARKRGADEGIWLNDRGHLAEGCASSVFVVWRRKLFTPSIADGILPGVIRTLVLRAARGLGLIVHEGKVRLRRLQTADEAFLTSSVRAVRPLVELEGRPVGSGRPGPITRALASAVADMRTHGVPAPLDETGGAVAEDGGKR